jgi:hypothetical protein
MWDLPIAKQGCHPLDRNAQCDDTSIMLDVAVRSRSLATEMWSSNALTKLER